MNPPLDDLYRLGVKIFLEPTTTPDPRACIAVFHGWIRDKSLDGLWIDVADYTHLVDGPSVLLVGHRGNLSLDFSGGRAGLFYVRKRPDNLSWPARVGEATRMVLTAGRLLENVATFDPRVRFRGSELEVVANDRLVAPPAESTTTALRGGLQPLVDTLFAGAAVQIGLSSSPHDRPRLSFTTQDETTLETLLSRLS